MNFPMVWILTTPTDRALTVTTPVGRRNAPNPLNVPSVPERRGFAAGLVVISPADGLGSVRTLRAVRPPPCLETKKCLTALHTAKEEEELVTKTTLHYKDMGRV